MRTVLIATLAGLATGVAGLALADDGSRRPALDGVASTLVHNLRELGYRVSHVEAERGRLELRAVNETELPIKLTYDLATGDMLRAALR